MKSKIKIVMKILANLLAVAFVFVLFIALNIYIQFEGSPFVKIKLKKVAENYISKFNDESFYVDEVGYSFKRKIYYAEVKSDLSKDRYFEVEMNENGEVLGDDTNYIYSGTNTYARINREYEELTEIEEDGKVFSGMEFDKYSYLDRVYEEKYEKDPHKIFVNTLEIDKEYDVNLLGKDYGVIQFRFGTENPDIELLSEILLEIKDIYDRRGVNFYKIGIYVYFTNSYDELILKDFLYVDFNSENLLQKIEEKVE